MEGYKTLRNGEVVPEDYNPTMIIVPASGVDLVSLIRDNFDLHGAVIVPLTDESGDNYLGVTDQTNPLLSDYEYVGDAIRATGVVVSIHPSIDKKIDIETMITTF